jgi:tRNA A-37 threonylcarbamoyl transferase component Bud32/tetratricopeptide (TPR) repeat protein
VETEASDPVIGQTIDDRYRVRRLLGRGGMGTVYEADHVGLDRRVAIKFVTTELDVAARERFSREARAAGRVIDPHVVQIFDVGRDAGRPFLVMEYLEGRDLRAVLRDGPMQPARALAIARQILAGLAAIHDAGIVHRDIKPANIFLSEGSISKIMDFGISKSAAERGESLTHTGHVVGTPEFMAPEQLLDGEVDHRADLYAVALVVYAMLAGRAPFAASSSMEMVAMQLRDAPPALDELVPDLDPAIVAAVMRCLAKAPAERFASARDFSGALAGALAETAEAKSAATRSVPTKFERPADIARDAHDQRSPPRRRWWPLAIVALAVAAVVAVVAIVRSNGDDPVLESAPDPLSAAVAAERAGKPELAIARYTELHETTHEPDLLFRIGEIYERLDRKADAIRYFERYLDAAPAARDRQAVIARIARLSPLPPVDAAVVRVGVVDAGVAVVDARPRVVAAKPSSRCRCVGTLSSKLTFPYHLCSRRFEGKCRCNVLKDTIAWICPMHFVECKGDCIGPKYNDVQYTCPGTPRYGSYHATAKPGSACSGYSDRDAQQDPVATANAPVRQGAYECSFCTDWSKPKALDAWLYPDQPGAACQGYLDSSGEITPGRIACKDSW